MRGLDERARLLARAERDRGRLRQTAPPQGASPEGRRAARVVLDDDRDFGREARERGALARKGEAVHVQDVGPEVLKQPLERGEPARPAGAEGQEVILHAALAQGLDVRARLHHAHGDARPARRLRDVDQRRPRGEQLQGLALEWVAEEAQLNRVQCTAGGGRQGS